MITTLRTDITVADICDGFVYNQLEGKGLYGLSGKLTIQPEYQRNYIYADGGGKKEQAVQQAAEELDNIVSLGWVDPATIAEHGALVFDTKNLMRGHRFDGEIL